MKELTHLDKLGRVQMVDVSEKAGTQRTAIAEGFISVAPETMALVSSGEIPKGNVITTAKLAGIQAAQKTAQLIPLCHNIALTWADVQIESQQNQFRITATVKAKDVTGVEMEALTAVAVSALTIYDMCKAVDKTMKIHGIRLLEKHGGKSEFISEKTPS